MAHKGRHAGSMAAEATFPLSQSRESPPGGRVRELRDGET
jgi:hypothetical protein